MHVTTHVALTFQPYDRMPDGSTAPVDKDKRLLFNLLHSDDQILMGAKLTTVGLAYHQQSEKSPDPTLAYHVLDGAVDAATKKFKVQRTNDVYFFPKPNVPAEAEEGNNPGGHGCKPSWCTELGRSGAGHQP